MPRFGFGSIPVTDDIPLSNVYPLMYGRTLGQSVTMTGAAGDLSESEGGGSASAAPTLRPSAMLGGQKSFLAAGATLVALLFLLMWSAKRAGKEGDFSNIRASAYNVLVIGLAVTVVIPVFKFLTTKWQIPGISPWVHAV